MNWLQQVYLVFARSRASLYHFTTLENAYRILKDNILRKSEYYGNVSFTRDKRLSWGSGHLGKLFVRLKINQDLLRHKYKIKPFVYESIRNAKDGRWLAEEVIDFDIKNFDKFLEEMCITNIKQFQNLITRADIFNDESVISDFKYESEQYPDLLELDGSKLYNSSNSISGIEKIASINNEIFYLAKIIRHPKLDAKSKANARKVKESFEDGMEKFYELVEEYE